LSTIEIFVPDIGGGVKDVDVIELLVKSGDEVDVEESLITLESDKATMEVPSPYAGVVKDMKVKVGDKVSQGSLILTMEIAGAAEEQKPAAAAVETPAVTAAPSPPPSSPPPQPAQPVTPQASVSSAEIYAGPGVRRLAREFGVDLGQVVATGQKNRITKEDVQSFVKRALGAPSAGVSGLAVSPAPVIDFAQFGEIENKPLNKIKKLTGVNVHRSWVTVPHVTQFIEADITELEAFREQQKAIVEKQGFKLTPIVFIMKAVVVALKKFPQFNASLSANGEEIILKKYFHLGVAVDTPNGLVVPVIRDVDKKGLLELAQELAKISVKAREKGLFPADMQGACFTISSLGGIGGTAFTPIVNSPEVAILGVSKASMKPVYQDDDFMPRLMLPLSLSYDHRVIDGADGARFAVFLSEVLEDIRTLLL
jgi:pyruvate dehydrogenase E2 component (dihydrolipoyllysine-residue acetyltransferase)